VRRRSARLRGRRRHAREGGTGGRRGGQAERAARHCAQAPPRPARRDGQAAILGRAGGIARGEHPRVRSEAEPDWRPRRGPPDRRARARCGARRVGSGPRQSHARPARAGRSGAPLAIPLTAAMVTPDPRAAATLQAMATREEERALVHEVADAIGALMEFWGFKRFMGRLWTVLYLTGEPPAAAELCERLP